MEYDEECASSSADESNDSAKEDHRDTNGDEECIVEQEETDVNEEVTPACRRRRKRTITKWPEDKIVVTEVTPDGMPIEKKARNRMRRLTGLIVRQRISLVLASFNALSEEQKKKLFDDCVKPRLEFPSALEAKAYKKMMQIIAKSWRTHKSDLVRNYINKGLDATVKHTYMQPKDWADFVALKRSKDEIAKIVRYKKLREKSVHEYCLGIGGYAGKAEKWEQEDRELAAEGISNPWDKYPPGRSRSWLHARSKLVKSDGSAYICWLSDSAQSVSEQIIKKKAEHESSGLTLVRERDVLTEVLGCPEQTGRVRGVSSYCGWEYWPDCTSLYRKRKCSNVDVEAIKEEVRSQLTQEVTKRVTKDIMAMLREQGVHLSLPPNTTTSVGGLKSSCASASDAICNVQVTGHGGTRETCSLDLLTEPTSCTLVINLGGYQTEVARGRVSPQQTEINSVLIQDGYVVVQVDFVYPEHEGFVLIHPPSDEITTLGGALSKMIQWRRVCIVVPPKVASNLVSSRPSVIGLAKSNLNALVVHNDPCSQGESRNGVEKSDPKEPTKSTRASTINRQCPRPRKSGSKVGKKQVGVKKKQQQLEPTKSSKSAPVASVWIHANTKFKFGQPILSAADVEKAGPGCGALHAYYMKACAENRMDGIVTMIKREHFWHESETEAFIVGLDDLFDLLTLDALDMSILRCLTLCLIVEARNNSVPVDLLDPDPLSISSMTSDRAYSVGYLEQGLRKHANKEFVMFTHNCGGHWVAVIIIPKC